MIRLLFTKVRRLSRAACLALAGAAALSGCGAEPADGGEDIAETYTSFEDFEAQTAREPGTGFYVVDGDIVLSTREELRAFYEQHVLKDALIVNTVSGGIVTWNNAQKLALTYCVSTDFGPNYDAVRKAMNDAGAAWSQAANVRFIHDDLQDNACNSLNKKVVFDVRPVTGSPYLARAFFPGQARDKSNIIIDSISFGSIAPFTLTGILRHELGHVLGFRHEHTRPQAATCFEDNNWRSLSSYDSASVMHYPSCNGTQGGDLILTERDQLAAAALLGRKNGGAKNLAYGKGASQSSTAYGGLPATCATDGNIDGAFYHRSVTATEGELSPWWQVDLGSVQAVGEVVIYNKTDGDIYKLSNFNLMVSKDNVSWRTISFPGTAGVRITLPVNEAARYVKIQLNANGTMRQLELAEVEVLQARNLARSRVTSQSSIASGGLSERAVDGNTNGSYGNKSVTHTADELSPWWQVDLGAIQPIGDVVLYNRTDCCANRLSNFKLLVSNDGVTWSEYAYPGIAGVRTSFAVNRAGRFVKVQLNDNGALRPLSLAEVEVLAGRNLARGKVATQSSEYGAEPGPASLAIDGLTNGVHSAGTVTHTGIMENTPWWQVDLGSVQPVGEVVLYNRTDCCSNRLSNFKLMLSTDGMSFTEYPYPGTVGLLATMVVNQSARYVKVQLNNSGVTRPLSLAEVEVIASRNLALAMPATQSSTYVDPSGPAVASRANDGNTDGDYFASLSVSVTNEQAQPWWQVDLGSSQPIGEVVLWNRTDSGYGSRLTNFKLLISEDGVSYDSFPYPGTAGVRTSFATTLVGRYVKVQLNGTNFLQLADVEVNLKN